MSKVIDKIQQVGEKYNLSPFTVVAVPVGLVMFLSSFTYYSPVIWLLCIGFVGYCIYKLGYSFLE